jgi:hypothetical protein
VTLLAYSRPFWPLFLHVLGTMVLFGAVLAALILAIAGLARPAFVSLLIAIPAWVVALGAGHWLEHDEGLGSSNATWLKLGHNVLEPGVLVLLIAIGTAWWWRSSGKAIAGRITAGLSGIYLLLLTVAMLAMSGKWGA